MSPCLRVGFVLSAEVCRSFIAHCDRPHDAPTAIADNGRCIAAADCRIVSGDHRLRVWMVADIASVATCILTVGHGDISKNALCGAAATHVLHGAIWRSCVLYRNLPYSKTMKTVNEMSPTKTPETISLRCSKRGEDNSAQAGPIASAIRLLARTRTKSSRPASEGIGAPAIGKLLGKLRFDADPGRCRSAGPQAMKSDHAVKSALRFSIKVLRL